MRKELLLIVAVAIAGGLFLLINRPAGAAGEGWLTDYEEALAESKATGKPILADFSGSDWCGWCVKLEDEVFSKQAFKDWAEENVVLLFLDYPRRTPQAAELKAQNAALLQKYNIGGFPTVLLLDHEGKSLFKTGYVRGGVKAWLDQAQPAVDAYRATHGVPVAGDLDSAFLAADMAGKLVLVLAPNSEEGDDLVAALLQDQEFVALARERVIAVVINSADDSPRAEALEGLADDLDAGDGNNLLLLSADGEELFGEVELGGEVEELVDAVSEVMPLPAYDGQWLEDFEEAKTLAAALDRPMLVDFSGSDWCGWCMKLDEEVFSKKAFQDYAKENLVLVLLDYPRETPQPEELKEQNAGLLTAFGVGGFPTVVLLSPEGEELRRGGYMRGGPVSFVEWVSSAVEED